MDKVVRFFSIVALGILLSVSIAGIVHATGTSSIEPISTPVRSFTQTLLSQDVLGNVGLVCFAVLGFAFIFGHFAGGFGGLIVGIIGLSIVFGVVTISQGFGWTAVGF